MSSSSGSEIEEIQMQIDANQNLTNLNESLHVIEESPVKLQGLLLHDQIMVKENYPEHINLMNPN